LTVASYLSGSVVAGVAMGGLLGLAGAGLEAVVGDSGAWVVVVVAAAGLGGAALDLGVGGLRVPSALPRQVNDQWLTRYRGWVYGAGFGFQLGLGVATFVTTAAVYGTWLVAFLSASPLIGVAIGAAFGGARSAVILIMARVDDRVALAAVHRRIAAWAGAARRAAAGAQVALALVVIGVGL
jgi:hypothetical protein